MAKSTSSITSSSSSSSLSSLSLSSASSSRSNNRSLNKSLKSSSSIDRRKRLAANARERKRMNLLNKAYDELRFRLIDAENKSKYDVLVQAKEYIQALATICEKFDRNQQEHSDCTDSITPTSSALSCQPVNMTIKYQMDDSNSTNCTNLLSPPVIHSPPSAGYSHLPQSNHHKYYT